MAGTAITWAISARNSATYGSKNLPLLTQSHAEDSLIVFHSATNAPLLHDLHQYDTMVNTLLRPKLRLHTRPSATDMHRFLTNVTPPLISAYDAAMRGLVRGLSDTRNSERADLRTWATHRWTNKNKTHAVLDESRIQEALTVISTHFVKLTKNPPDYAPSLTYVVRERFTHQIVTDGT